MFTYFKFKAKWQIGEHPKNQITITNGSELLIKNITEDYTNECLRTVGIDQQFVVTVRGK